jgi:uncharacterized DUF497 family protein
MSLAFEWDAAKAARNHAKHGVRFETARRAFRDPFAVEWLDDRFDYGEERYNLLGMVEGRLLVATCNRKSANLQSRAIFKRHYLQLTDTPTDISCNSTCNQPGQTCNHHQQTDISCN